MKTYILLKENFTSPISGSDVLIQIDGRLNSINKKLFVKKHLEKLSKYKPWLLSEVKYVALFESSEYKNGNYYYKNGLIKL